MTNVYNLLTHSVTEALDYSNTVMIQYFVEDVVRTVIFHLNHYIGMQEVGSNHVWHEWSALLLKHYGHDVISYMPLPLQLLKDTREFMF